jgi:hypothetical protein
VAAWQFVERNFVMRVKVTKGPRAGERFLGIKCDTYQKNKLVPKIPEWFLQRAPTEANAEEDYEEVL